MVYPIMLKREARRVKQHCWKRPGWVAIYMQVKTGIGWEERKDGSGWNGTPFNSL